MMPSPIIGSATAAPDRDGGGAGDDGEADVGVGPGVRAVGHERGVVEPAAGAGADHRRPPVAREADGAGDRERAEILGLVRMISRSIAS